MDKAGIEKGVSELVGAMVSRRGFELVDVEVSGSARNPVLRVYIDKPGGISVDDCADVSRELGDRLDEKDLVPAAYVLEVSSPGLDRPLRSLDDFRRFAGSPAKVRMLQPFDGQRNFTGTIIGVEGEEIVFEDKTSGEARLPHSLVAKANLEVDLEAELGRRR